MFKFDWNLNANFDLKVEVSDQISIVNSIHSEVVCARDAFAQTMN